MLIDKYVGKAIVIVDHSEKKDHKILEIVKPKLRELNPSSFTPNDFRLPDTVNNHMFYQYEILGTIYIYVENNDLQKLVLQVDVLDALALDDETRLNNTILDAMDFYVDKKLDLGAGIEMMNDKKIGFLIKSLVSI
jgi:hypothetical protein